MKRFAQRTIEKEEEILNLGRESKRSCNLQHKLKATVFYVNPSDNFVIFTLQVNSKIIYDRSEL